MDRIRGLIVDELARRQLDETIGVIVPASPFDSYCTGARWFSASSFYAWAHGTRVDAIHFCQTYPFQVGQPFEVYSPVEETSIYLEIQGIKMVNAADLDDDDLALLGFDCRSGYAAQDGQYACLDHGWLIWGRPIADIALWLGPDAAACQRTLLEITLHSQAIGHVRAYHPGPVPVRTPEPVPILQAVPVA